MRIAVPVYDTDTSEKDNRHLPEPGTLGYPVVGHTFDFLNNPLALAPKEYKKYGPVFRQPIAFQRRVANVGPDMVKLVTLDPKKLFSSQLGGSQGRLLLRQSDVDRFR
jgi:hypothetical protein